MKPKQLRSEFSLRDSFGKIHASPGGDPLIDNSTLTLLKY